MAGLAQNSLYLSLSSIIMRKDKRQEQQKTTKHEDGSLKRQREEPSSRVEPKCMESCPVERRTLKAEETTEEDRRKAANQLSGTKADHEAQTIIFRGQPGYKNLYIKRQKPIIPLSTQGAQDYEPSRSNGPQNVDKGHGGKQLNKTRRNCQHTNHHRGLLRDGGAIPSVAPTKYSPHPDQCVRTKRCSKAICMAKLQPPRAQSGCVDRPNKSTLISMWLGSRANVSPHWVNKRVSLTLRGEGFMLRSASEEPAHLGQIFV